MTFVTGRQLRDIRRNPPRLVATSSRVSSLTADRHPGLILK
jgi:hypothetical protein